jgi:hypothetical protein
MSRPTLAEKMSEEKLKYYIKSGLHYRFAFFDPKNPYRTNGLFDELEESIKEVGEKLKDEFGHQFISINLRGSWLRGIPFKGDDIDLLFIVNSLPQKQKNRIMDYTRDKIEKKNDLFQVCKGKIEYGLQVEPISFLDFSQISTILNCFMFGCRTILGSPEKKDRDAGQDTLLGSNAKEKLVSFLKSGILIPYVGWVYGQEHQTRVFDEISKYLPVPTEKTRIYSAQEVDLTKEVIRETFIARNLIYPALNIKRFTRLTGNRIKELKEEALSLYASLYPLENIHARAVINYIFITKIEHDFYGKNFTKKRIEKFAPEYDQLLEQILNENK